MYALSVTLAIIGVLGGMVLMQAAGNMVIGILMEFKNGRFYLHWGLIAGLKAFDKDYLHLSTTFLIRQHFCKHAHPSSKEVDNQPNGICA